MSAIPAPLAETDAESLDGAETGNPKSQQVFTLIGLFVAGLLDLDLEHVHMVPPAPPPALVHAAMYKGSVAMAKSAP